MEVLSRAVRAPGVIGDVEEAVLFTVGELSPRSPRGPPSHTLADGSSRRTLRDGNEKKRTCCLKTTGEMLMSLEKQQTDKLSALHLES